MRRIRKDKGIEVEIRRNVPVFEADAQRGLSTKQAEERAQAGWDNRPIEPPGKTVGQIVRSNVLTYFNMLFFLLAAAALTLYFMELRRFCRRREEGGNAYALG